MPNPSTEEAVVAATPPSPPTPARLALEDGSVYDGEAFGDTAPRSVAA